MPLKSGVPLEFLNSFIYEANNNYYTRKHLTRLHALVGTQRPYLILFPFTTNLCSMIHSYHKMVEMVLNSWICSVFCSMLFRLIHTRI